EIVVVNVQTQRVVSRVVLEQTFYGLSFSAHGRQLFASGGELEVVHRFDFVDGYLAGHREIPIVSVKEKFLPAGLAIDDAAKKLYIAGSMGDAVCVCSLSEPTNHHFIKFERQSYPYACLLDVANSRLFVSLWGKAALAVIDLKTRRVVGNWA